MLGSDQQLISFTKSSTASSMQAEHLGNVAPMELHSFGRNVEGHRNFLRRFTFRDQLKDFALSGQDFFKRVAASIPFNPGIPMSIVMRSG